MYLAPCLACVFRIPCDYKMLLHTTGFSDPYVQLLLMPERKLKIKAVKTDYKNKELNPTYYKEFKMYVLIYVCLKWRAGWKILKCYLKNLLPHFHRI